MERSIPSATAIATPREIEITRREERGTEQVGRNRSGDSLRETIEAGAVSDARARAGRPGRRDTRIGGRLERADLRGIAATATAERARTGSRGDAGRATISSLCARILAMYNQLRICRSL